MSSTLARRLAAAVLLLLVAGCDSVDPIEAVNPEASVAVATAADLAAAFEAWRASDVDRYEVATELSCECAGGDRVAVRDGQVVRTRRRDRADALTVDRIYAMALQALEQAEARPASIETRVRLSAGRPQIPVFIATGTTDPRVADGGYVLTVTGFEAR